jgi:hypothetical protein
MRLPPLAVAAFAGLLASTGTRLVGQSLGEIARQEAERRKKVTTGSKVYTNKDLRDVPPATSPAPLTEAPAAPPAGPDAAPKETTASKTAEASAAKAPEAESPARDQAYWAGRMKNLRDTLARNETYLDALQSRINALTTDFVNRDDPAQRAVIGSDRERALAEFDRLKIQIEADRKAIADLEQEARRASVPPGWLR